MAELIVCLLLIQIFLDINLSKANWLLDFQKLLLR